MQKRNIPFDLIAKPIHITLEPAHVDVIQSIFEAFFSSARVMEIDVPRDIKLDAAAVLHKIIVEYERQIEEANDAQGASNPHAPVQKG